MHGQVEGTGLVVITRAVLTKNCYDSRRKSAARMLSAGQEDFRVAVTSSSEPIAVPPLNLAGNFAQQRAEILREIAEICDSGYYVLGPKVNAFEENLAQWTGAKHALGVSSGTDAILLAMMALDIGPGDEVIVPTFTFFATAGCVARLRATPVFVDVLPETFNMDMKQVAAKITPRTKAIMPVHLYGQIADMAALDAVA